MTVAAGPRFDLDDSFARELVGLYEPWAPAPVADPSLLVLNDALATELGLDPEALRSPEGVAVLGGNSVPQGVTTLAQAYAGHQFGGYSPRLGDGRALLLGEFVDADGTRRDLHLKGSGRTPFARGGDGRAAVGPMLREYLMGEAMHALGIPTTRALAVVGHRRADPARTRRPQRRGPRRGPRTGRLESPSRRNVPVRLGDRRPRTAANAHATTRSPATHPTPPNRSILRLRCSTMSWAFRPRSSRKWMTVGFVHGVMNTDNTTISGETIDYGPCAFMDAYDPATVFSSIDHGGRYAYGNQPAIVTWNLARLAEAMLALFDDDADAAIELATGVLQDVPRAVPDAPGATEMHAKLGLDAGATDTRATDGGRPQETPRSATSSH